MSKSKEIQWRKTGGGSLRYIRGRIIKPNEIFTARPEEIPLAFRKQIVTLEDVPGETIKFNTKRIYKTQERSAGGWWDVVNSVSGKVMNEKGLRAEAARKLAEELNA